MTMFDKKKHTHTHKHNKYTLSKKKNLYRASSQLIDDSNRTQQQKKNSFKSFSKNKSESKKKINTIKAD